MRKLFVYGTLKKNGKWHHILENEKFLGADVIRGVMFLHSGGYYPILFQGSQLVEGEVYAVNDRAYQRALDLESGADYDIQVVKTEGGQSVEVFFMKGRLPTDKSQKISNFDASAFFKLWLEKTPHSDPNFLEFLQWGGKTPIDQK